MKRMCVGAVVFAVLAVFSFLAAAPAAELNTGDVVYVGGDGAGGLVGDPGHTVPDGYENRGSVTAIGGNSDGLGNGGYGIYVRDGGFVNNGGTVTAIGGSNGGNGIEVQNGGFTNASGTMIAASGTGAGGAPGIRVGSGNFRNSGQLILAAGGDGAAVYLLGPAGQTMTFASGSTLALAGGWLDMDENELTVESGAKLESLTATTLAVGGSTNHNKFIQYTDNDTAFTDSNTATLTYAVSYDGENYSAIVERNAYASSLASGEGASLLSGLESVLAGKGDADGNLDSAYLPYALLYAHADNQPDAASVRNAGYTLHRESTPQATATVIPRLTAGARLAASVFADNLLFAAGLDGDNASVAQALSGTRGSAFASLSPDCGAAGTYIWATPFFHYGKQDGSAGYSDLRERIAGGSIGVAVNRAGWTLGFSGHYMHIDFDGESVYDGRANGYGLSLGAGRAFRLGGLTPWLSLSAGWTRFALRQTRIARAASAGAYSSRPDTDVFAASLTASNPLSFGRARFIPRLGIDYAYTDMESYTERSLVGLTPWRVRAESYASFRSVVGASFSYAASPSVSVDFRGDYYHEFGDRGAVLSSRDPSGLPVAIRTRGQDPGRDFGRLGVGVNWRPSARTRVGLDYDCHLGKDYVGHRLAATVRIAF